MYETEIAEITSRMLLEFTIYRIEDTLDNRVAFLEGLRQAWIEDTSKSPEKVQYQRALQFEINRINADIMDEYRP